MRRLSKKKCSVDGCGRGAYERGWCIAHYNRVRRHGSPGAARIAPRIKASVRGAGCSVAGCRRPRRRSAYCSSHAHRVHRYGTPFEPERRSRGVHKCAVEGCERFVAWGRNCPAHARQLLVHGRITSVRLRHVRPKGEGSITPDGYRVVVRHGHPNSMPNGAILEHRWIAAEYLERPLRRDEHVHHRNNIKDDNSIGPCLLERGCTCETWHNLELWAKVQPSGGRVADLVRFASMILDRYHKDYEVVHGPDLGRDPESEVRNRLDELGPGRRKAAAQTRLYAGTPENPTVRASVKIRAVRAISREGPSGRR
jgi:hypothetical protein